MKSFISIACALLLLGCSNETKNGDTSQAPAVVEENVSVDTPVADTAVQAVTPTVSTPTEQPTLSNASVDGGALYTQKCASCHGAKAEKAALNKSQVIADFSESQIQEALKGYQVGTYGKEMKALMQGQAKALDNAQIEALAKHISNL